MEYLIGAVLGLLAGAATAWIVAISRRKGLEEEISRLKGDNASIHARMEEKELRASEIRKEIDDFKGTVEKLRAEAATLDKDRIRLETELQNQKTATEEKMELLHKAELKLQDTFKALSAEALNKNNEAFLDLAKTKMGAYQKEASMELEARKKAIDELVKPIHESLVKVDSKLQESEKARNEAYGRLSEQVKGMALTQQQLQSETGNLVKALRAPQVRGRWGEIQLKRVVEMAGMLDHCDFEEQISTSTEDGRLRPDLVVHLPGGKDVIVDAKTPLKSYLEAIETTDEATREAMFKDHARQVRDHITKLGSKTYWSQFNTSPEFVVMFLPGETFYSSALQND
ncbi:MAG: DNA recombination protein RmuC, partial [Planctomycetes bacterium]|nr:DNA recombination protein RmuC [Planctomycetota bacterium]